LSVALVGSSGGGAATLGHTDSAELIRLICQEVSKVKGDPHPPRLTKALFTSLKNGKGFDYAKFDTDLATLHSIQSDEQSDQYNVQAIKSGILQDVNSFCANLDTKLAESIRKGDIHGLICISCDIDVHAATLQAAADMKIPATGSGGTSLSAASSRFGLRLVGNAGGSVATTSYTRAVSYTHALATSWNRDYKPYSYNQTQAPQWKSVLDSCLPAFWAVALACRGIELVCANLSDANWLQEDVLVLLRAQALPMTCCVVMATSFAPQHDSIILMTASIASVVCKGSILGGLLAGWMVASAMDRVFHRCIIWNIPATMINLILGGGVGAVVGITVSPFISYMQILTESVRSGIHFVMNGAYPGLGFIVGVVFCWGSKVGYYHSVGLPLILIEMELGFPSLLGAIDEATLVLVSAGICSANLLVPLLEDGADAAMESKELCSRGVRINILFGDFIEVAYPFMERSKLVNLSGYLASGLATELLTGNSRSVLSSAYLPCFVSIMLANDWCKIFWSYMTAFSVSFLGTTINNVIAKMKILKKKET